MSLKKLVYILWRPEEWDRARTRDTLLGRCAPRLLEAGAARLTMAIADPESRVRSPAPPRLFERPVCALVNLWIDDENNRGPFEEVLRSAGFRIAGYLVEESVYTDYGGNRHAGPRDWPDGQRSPGVTAVTLMERPKRIPRDEWIRRWHGTMSPVSEEIQPRTRYVRNLVLEAVTPGAPPFEGIVEECWPSPRHVTNPFLFYGARNPWQLARNMARILRAVAAFLSLWRIRTVMMSEYFIKTR
jgi:hypothetical protein